MSAARPVAVSESELRAMNNLFPYYVKGQVVEGFGRGSKELGVPTANFPDEVVDSLPPQLACGVYCGFASVSAGALYPMVMSIGWNDFYKNAKRSAEVHILRVYERDFYGEELRAVVTHHIRPMWDFRSVDELIQAIQSDIGFAKATLSEAERDRFARDKFFDDGCAAAAASVPST